MGAGRSVITEDELDARFGTRALLASGGDYGLNVVVFEGDRSGNIALHDDEVRALCAGTGDVGTIVFAGNLTSTGHLCVSDRLMCLIVTGDVVCERLSLFETEMLVMGSLTTKALKDHDEYFKVLGARTVERLVRSGED